MKVLMFLLLFAFNAFAMPQGFVIEGVKKIPGMDYQMELVIQNQLQDHQLVLDCQSFINGLHYRKLINDKWQDEWFLIMSGNDCEDASLYSKQSFDNNNLFCLKADLDFKSINFYEDINECN